MMGLVNLTFACFALIPAGREGGLVWEVGGIGVGLHCRKIFRIGLEQRQGEPSPTLHSSPEVPPAAACLATAAPTAARQLRIGLPFT